MGKIYVESNDVKIGWDTVWDHIYLVYQDDNGNEFVIRGGPKFEILDGDWDLLDEIIVQINEPIVSSKDARGSDTPQQRGQIELDLGGRPAADVWGIMKTIAQEIHDSVTNYKIKGPNSNSVIRTILDEVAVPLVLPSNTNADDALGWEDTIPGIEAFAYIVKDGDTLGQIAADNDMTTNELRALNPDMANNPDLIHPGDLVILKDTQGAQDFAQWLKDNPNAGQDVIDQVKKDLVLASLASSPIILDLDGDGIVETTSKTNSGVYFDHDNNGFKEQSGWVGKDDGLLVYDRNNNGTIDDGSELFGNNTLLSNGEKAANGFEALKDLDSNDDIINHKNQTLKVA